MILEFFKYIFFFCYKLVSVKKGYSLIFESLVSKIWFDSLLKLSIISYFLLIEIIVEIFRGSTLNTKLNSKFTLPFIGQEISGTITFPTSLKKKSLNHNCFSEFFIYEGRLVTANMFFLYWGININ